MTQANETDSTARDDATTETSGHTENRVTDVEEVRHGWLGLTDRQRTTVAAAITTLATLVIVAAVCGMFWLLGLFFGRFSHVILPVAVAGVLALLLDPIYDWLRRRGLPPIPALIAVHIVVAVPLTAVVWSIGGIVVAQIDDLVTYMPKWWAQLEAWLETQWPALTTWLETNPWGQRLRAAAESQQEAALDQLGSLGGRLLAMGGNVLGWIGALLNWAVLPVYLSFLLLGGNKLATLETRDVLPFLKAETRDDVAYLASEFVSIMVAFFRGQLVIAFLQGCLFALGFSLVGLKFGLLIGLVLGFLNIVPYLGNMVGLGVALPLALFQEGGGWVLLASVLIVFAVVQVVEGYVLTPRIMGSQTGLHPMVIIIAIFFWGSALNGIAGMILAIPLTAFFVVLWRLAREKYIRELV
ncbi:MAG: AI-2E family transporter [Acidobacteriota bacterium]